MYRKHEHYPDPTAGRALGSLRRKENQLNTGKQFEADWKSSMPKDAWCYRLKDSATTYYGGNENLSFSIDNICDFDVYRYPMHHYFELKTIETPQCGYKTVTVKCDENGNIDLEDFRAKAEENKERLAASMITYPSTHGIFEVDIKEMCDIVHACGGQLYMDGANMNAQVGLTNPGTIGADVCHLNLHKTFSSPHGGGGPGVGPICVAEHLVPFLPQHPVLWGSDLNTVSAAPYGSAGILPITYAYIRLLGTEGLETVTKTAILNANYLAAKFKDTYGIVYTGATGRVGHELILECRTVKERSGIDEGDIAKRLMDFGYHAPTLSFPVHGTLMVEPTESESKAELDRFVEVMECIWSEIKEVEEGKASKEDNVLKNAPHPEYEVTADEWKHAYPRTKAAFPLEWLHDSKFWINVARVDNAYGDRNLIPTLCACEI